MVFIYNVAPLSIMGQSLAVDISSISIQCAGRKKSISFFQKATITYRLLSICTQYQTASLVHYVSIICMPSFPVMRGGLAKS